jgi:hypothetical protein
VDASTNAFANRGGLGVLPLGICAAGTKKSGSRRAWMMVVDCGRLLPILWKVNCIFKVLNINKSGSRVEAVEGVSVFCVLGVFS